MSDASPSSTQLSSILGSKGSAARSFSLSPETSIKNKKWSKLRSTVIATHLFKTPDVSVMQDLNELLEEIEHVPFPQLPADRTELSAAIESHRITECLFSLVAQGSVEDIAKLETLLQNDPHRYFCDVADHQSLVNRKSQHGHTLLYDAALHGNAGVVKVLLRYGGDAHELNAVGDHETETALDAASRWGHLKVVELLVTCEKWSIPELKSALKHSGNFDITRLLTPLLAKSKAKKRCFFCF